jgi:hypothetical protein
MIPTGVCGLDEILGGGIPDGSRSVFSMEPGVNGQLFTISILACALARGQSCLVILPHTSAEAFLHDAEILRTRKLEYEPRQLHFMDNDDRYQIRRTNATPEQTRQAWQDRIAAICREYRIKVLVVYLDLISEDFGIENGLRMLDSACATSSSTLVVEYLNLKGPDMPEQFIRDYHFDIVIAIRRSFSPLLHFNYFTILKAAGGMNEPRSIPFIISEGKIVPYIPRIVITGPAKSGKSTFVASASHEGLSVDRLGEDGTATTVVMDLGRLTWKDFDITLYGTPGEPRFDPLIPPMLRHAMGAILVLDSNSPETLPRAREMVQQIIDQKIPVVIAANSRDKCRVMTADAIRSGLAINQEIPIFFISAMDKDHVATVLESLIDFITRFTY